MFLAYHVRYQHPRSFKFSRILSTQFELHQLGGNPRCFQATDGDAGGQCAFCPWTYTTHFDTLSNKEWKGIPGSDFKIFLVGWNYLFAVFFSFKIPHTVTPCLCVCQDGGAASEWTRGCVGCPAVRRPGIFVFYFMFLSLMLYDILSFYIIWNYIWFYSMIV